MSNDSNSTDLSILLHAPQMVAQAFEEARRDSGDGRNRLRRKLAFVDTLLRYLFAVLAAESRGLGQSVPEKCSPLIRRLTTPSWGNWAESIEALARSVIEAGGQPVAPGFAELVVQPGQHGKLVPTGFLRNVIQVIEVRNEVAHKDGSVFCTEDKARELLEGAVNPPLIEIATRLTIFATRPLLYVEEIADQFLGDSEITFLRMVGEKPETQTIQTSRRPALRSRFPFLLNEEGTALYLAPFVMIEAAPATGFPLPRLIDGWDDADKGPTYDSTDHGRRKPLQGTVRGMPSDVEGLFRLSSDIFRQERAVDTDVASELLRVHRGVVNVSIPGYEISRDRPLGMGAAATVYRARCKPVGDAPGEWVAVKVLHDSTLADVQRKRLELEYEVLKRLSHPCLPKVHAFGYEPLPYFVMEKVAGTSLKARIERGPLPLETVVWIAKSILDVLEVVHAEGAIHRDLKPSNIMITEDNSALKVIDFGIAITRSDPRFTGSLELVGTHGYAAPEQFTKTEPDHRVDLYALGRVLQEALIGNREDRVGTIPEGMQAIIHRATQPNRDHRFASAAEMRAALDERQAGNWEGVPVQANSPLDANHELLDLRHSIDDVWIFDAIEMTTRRRQAVALAVKPTARERLLDAARRQPDGSCTTQTTGVHSILFAVLPPDDEKATLERLLGGRPLWTRRSSRRKKTDPATAGPAAGSTTGSLLGALRLRIAELKALVDHATKDDEVTLACYQATAAFESMLLVWALHAARRDAIDDDTWRACPQPLIGVINWIVKLPMPHDGREELLNGMRRVADVRAHQSHSGGKGLSRPEIVHALMLACVLLDDAVVAAIPAAGSGKKPPYLTYDEAQRAWLLLRTLREGDRYEIFDHNWHRMLDAEERVAAAAVANASRGGKDSVAERLRALEWLFLDRPYVRQVVHGATIPGIGAVHEADMIVRASRDRVVLLVEVKHIGTRRYGDLQRARTREALWRKAQAFSAPYALLDEDGTQTWFAVDGMKGLREMPDDSEIVARFAAAAEDA